MKSVAHLDTY